MRSYKSFVWTPSPGRVLLRGGQESPGIRHRHSIFLMAEHLVSLARGAERDDVAVGVAARENVFAACQRIEEVAIEKVGACPLPHRLILRDFGRGEQVLRQHISFIVGWVLLANPVAALLGNIGER